MTKQELKKIIQEDIRAVYREDVSYEEYKELHRKVTKVLYKYKKDVALNG